MVELSQDVQDKIMDMKYRLEYDDVIEELKSHFKMKQFLPVLEIAYMGYLDRITWRKNEIGSSRGFFAFKKQIVNTMKGLDRFVDIETNDVILATMKSYHKMALEHANNWEAKQSK